MHAAHVDRLGLRADDDRRVRGDAGEQLARLVEEIVHRHRRGREEVGDAAPLGRSERAGAGEMVDVVAVAGVGGDPAGRGVGLGDEAVALEHRHLVADGRRRDAETGGVGDGLRADRLRAVDVVLDDRPQDGGLALVQLGHAARSRRWPTRGASRAPRWHSMLPSANGPREQEAGSHIGGEEPAVSGEHDPIVDPAHEPGRGELLDHRVRRGRRPARRGGCAAPARTLPRPGAPARAAPRPASADVPAAIAAM